MKLPIYLDYSATTPVDPRVAQKMIPYFTEHFGNPASRSHAFGWEAEEAVEEARAAGRRADRRDPKEIVWTSGATESNNLAIKGAAHFYGDKGKHIITVKTEHKAMLDTCASSSARASRSTYLDVEHDGLVDLEAFAAAMRPDTILVSMMLGQQRDRRDPGLAAIGGDLPRARRSLPHRRGAGGGQDPARRRGAQGRPDVASPATRSTARRASARCTCAASRACASRRRSTAAATSAACARARCRRPGSSAWARRSGWRGRRWRPRRARPDAARPPAGRDCRRIDEVYVNGDLEHRLPGNLNISFAYVEGEA